MIYIQFTMVHEEHGTIGTFIELDDDHTLTDEEIEVMKQQAYDNWVTLRDEQVATRLRQDLARMAESNN